jgi:hypothetical protein
MVYIDACKWLRLKRTLFMEQNLEYYGKIHPANKRRQN